MPRAGRQTSLHRKSLNFDVRLPRSTSVWGSLLESQTETGGQTIKRMLMIVGLSALVVLVGSGCSSMKNIREISLGFGGLDAEFYEAKESE